MIRRAKTVLLRIKILLEGVTTTKSPTTSQTRNHTSRSHTSRSRSQPGTRLRIRQRLQLNHILVTIGEEIKRKSLLQNQHQCRAQLRPRTRLRIPLLFQLADLHQLQRRIQHLYQQCCLRSIPPTHLRSHQHCVLLPILRVGRPPIRLQGQRTNQHLYQLIGLARCLRQINQPDDLHLVLTIGQQQSRLIGHHSDQRHDQLELPLAVAAVQAVEA